MSNIKEDLVVEVNNISKKFCRRVRHVMLYGSQDIIKDFIGIKSRTHYLRKGEFWAVNNVSFGLEKGETFGIIGVNGSGKSTILKMINGIYMPDDGFIKINGRVGALIEIGAGFHPMLTGRENIYINGSILGMSKKEIDKKFDEIVDLSELREFIDTPVKFYSSGMFVRLGFSIALFCNPDILLLDEILSVGDISFQNKAFKKLYNLKKRINGIIYVGHNMQHIRNMCDRIMVIDSGKKLFIGDVAEGIKFFQDFISKTEVSGKNKKEVKSFKRRYFFNYDNSKFEVIDFGVLGNDQKKKNLFVEHETIILYCDFEVKAKLEELEFSFGVSDENDRIAFLRAVSTDGNFDVRNILPGRYKVLLRYDNPCLSSGLYVPSLSIRNPSTGETYERIISNNVFNIRGGLYQRGVISTNKEWDFRRI